MQLLETGKIYTLRCMACEGESLQQSLEYVGPAKGHGCLHHIFRHPTVGWLTSLTGHQVLERVCELMAPERASKPIGRDKGVMHQPWQKSHHIVRDYDVIAYATGIEDDIMAELRYSYRHRNPRPRILSVASNGSLNGKLYRREMPHRTCGIDEALSLFSDFCRREKMEPHMNEIRIDLARRSVKQLNVSDGAGDGI